MNTIGRDFRIHIFGESHGDFVGITLDGCMPGVPISSADFINALNRRKGGLQQATTPRQEEDQPKIISGFFNGKTTGAPLTIIFENKNIRSADYEKIRQTPRPGHADFVASKKFLGFEDYRGGGHFSGRLTVCLVAAGVIAQQILRHQFYKDAPFICEAKVIEIDGQKDIEKGIQMAIENQDSVGGIVECVVKNLPVGLGEPFFDSVESLISHAVFSIPAIKGIEFGAGFAAAAMKGSEHNDSIIEASGKTLTNHAGGIVGGISNGNELVFSVAVKPASSTPQTQQTLNLSTGEIEPLTIKGRHDLCIALRVPVVLEAVTSCVLLDLMLRLKEST